MTIAKKAPQKKNWQDRYKQDHAHTEIAAEIRTALGEIIEKIYAQTGKFMGSNPPGFRSTKGDEYRTEYGGKIEVWEFDNKDFKREVNKLLLTLEGIFSGKITVSQPAMYDAANTIISQVSSGFKAELKHWYRDSSGSKTYSGRIQSENTDSILKELVELRDKLITSGLVAENNPLVGTKRGSFLS